MTSVLFVDTVILATTAAFCANVSPVFIIIDRSRRQRTASRDQIWRETFGAALRAELDLGLPFKLQDRRWYHVSTLIVALDALPAPLSRKARLFPQQIQVESPRSPHSGYRVGRRASSPPAMGASSSPQSLSSAHSSSSGTELLGKSDSVASEQLFSSTGANLLLRSQTSSTESLKKIVGPCLNVVMASRMR